MNTIPSTAPDGLYWYLVPGKAPEPVLIHRAMYGDRIKAFNGREQTWLRDGERLVGPVPAPAESELAAVNGPASTVSMEVLLKLLIEVRNDIKVAHGPQLPGSEIDAKSLDWPDLESTYFRIVSLLSGLVVGDEAKSQQPSDDEGKTWRRILVAIDPYKRAYPAFTDGTKWNGWECPFFELDVLKRAMQDLSISCVLDESTGTYTFIDPDDADGKEVGEVRTIQIDGAPYKVYSGLSGLCWDDIGE